MAQCCNRSAGLHNPTVGRIIRGMNADVTNALHYGIVGAGRVAQEHVKGALAAGGRIAAVHDAQVYKAEELAAFIANQGAQAPPRIARTLDELLAMDDVGCVVVAVPNVAHCDIATACLNAGKDVLLEKPMAMNLAECDAILAAMESNGRIVQLGFVCRGSPKVHAVRDILEAGTLGTVYHVKASAYRQRGIPGLGGWFTNRAMSGGGVLVDIGVHLIDLVMHLTKAQRARTVSGVCEARFGSPMDQYVYEEMWAGPPRLDGVCDVEDSAMGLIRFDNGMSCEMNLAWASNLPQQLLPDGIALLGDRGGLFFDLWGERLTLVTQQEGKVVERELPTDASDLWDRAWRWQHEQFTAAVQSRTAPGASAAQGRAVQEIIAAWQRSGEMQREVAVSAE